MSDFGTRIKKLRDERGFSQQKMADELGLTKSALNMYERGDRRPNFEILESIADYFNVDTDYLLGRANIRKKVHFDEDGTEYRPAATITKPRGIKIKVLGRVAAGVPIEAITDIIDEEEITEEMARTGEFFGLKIQGDSMEPRILDGDVVIVRQQSDVDSGDVAIVTVNGTDATCKRIRKYRDGIELIANNPKYEPKFYGNEDIEKLPITVIGKVVELRGKF
ncbi:repressor LexA [Aequitasia blattaphilus]|uniref:Helix-turn-helix domain-containing protein n=1 Tax=Aequitasia blattaphilus TaxID=2949332 RepID=A0ABT1ECL1_9FIRM|nr:XRE family transcriptional regulator [Aequitasia blattaphilus]MCP1103560.1 helix-turn-helix domain-containing protein [Aequitasia blattaphilus]MCR8616200.1 helix-turn-helix domain-containing protein [Aequitasia blattaphilus]